MLSTRLHLSPALGFELQAFLTSSPWQTRRPSSSIQQHSSPCWGRPCDGHVKNYPSSTNSRNMGVLITFRSMHPSKKCVQKPKARGSEMSCVASPTKLLLPTLLPSKPKHRSCPQECPAPIRVHTRTRTHTHTHAHTHTHTHTR